MAIRRYAFAAAAACMVGGVAAAQTTPASPPAADSAPAASPDQAVPPTSTQTDNAAPADVAASPGVSTTVTIDANGVRHSLIANAPVPDTSENRAKYGQPESLGGRRTQPAGN